jgi:hypothetical protein
VTKHVVRAIVLVACTIGFARVGLAQDTQPAASGKGIIPVRVQIVISRYEGDKKISSLPYTISVNANDRVPASVSTLRMGRQVPIVSYRTPPADSKDAPLPTIQYRDVGTNIDCAASTQDDGRFRVTITLDDSSVLADEPVAQQGLANGRPSFRSFRISEALLLKDGQSTQLTTATDKLNGEVVKVDVTLTVVK